MPAESKYWFPTKRHGWGWGWPTAWQGKLVVFVFYALVFAGAFVFLPEHNIALFVIYAAFLCMILIGVCLVKGEPPRWRSDGR